MATATVASRNSLTIPYSGRLLISHLAAYGLAFLLDVGEVRSFVAHDSGSQSFEPIVSFDASFEEAAAVVNCSALATDEVIEADIEKAPSVNDRRPVIWARASFAKEPERAGFVQGMRNGMQRIVEAEDDRYSAALLAGIGAPLSWGPGDLKPSHGATDYDGVLGNRTSDFVRGVLRSFREEIAAIEPDEVNERWWTETEDAIGDKTEWAPPGSRIDPLYQWLAAFGLALMPVGHCAGDRSRTPTSWYSQRPPRSGVTLPLLERLTSVARLRALLALRELPDVGNPAMADSPEALRAAGELRSLGVREVASFERRYASSSSSSLQFSFDRAERTGLR